MVSIRVSFVALLAVDRPRPRGPAAETKARSVSPQPFWFFQDVISSIVLPGMRNGTPLLDIEMEGEETGVRGWEGLAEWTGGLPPEQVEALAAVRELEAVYPLLHALVGRSPRELFVRAAVMETLVASARPAFSQQDLDEILYWLVEPARAAVLRALRQSGWLEFEPSTG